MKNIKLKNLFFDQSPGYDGLKSFLGSTNALVHFDSIIHISSLPSQRPLFRSSRLVSELNLEADSILSIGDNCTSIIDALEISQSISPRLKSTLIVADDDFAGYISESATKAKPGLTEWRSAKSAIALNHNTHDLQFRINRRVSKHRPEFGGMIEFDEQGMLVVNDSLARAFKNIDVESEIECIYKLLDLESETIQDYDAVILTNREKSRLARFREALGDNSQKIHSSRDAIGHTGASDIIFNLIQAIKSTNKQLARLLISSSGLGYVWSCASLSVENISNT